MSAKFTVLSLLESDLPKYSDLSLQCIAGKYGVNRLIRNPEINRPGLALNGFFEEFAAGRLQIFGKGEQAFLASIEGTERWINVRKILAAEIPCCIFTHGRKPVEAFLRDADEHHCPVLVTPLSSSEFSVRVLRLLSEVFAPQETIHGVMLEVFGMGVLLKGDSGVGKSEAALELIERGHRLVCDDAVLVRRLGGNLLMARGVNEQLATHLEVRGLGIINVPSLFGIAAIKDQKRINLVIELEIHDPNQEYDRLGIADAKEVILGVEVPKVTIFLKPGRNAAILIETAAIQQRLKNAGYDAAKLFNREFQRQMESRNAFKVYFEEHQRH